MTLEVRALARAGGASECRSERRASSHMEPHALEVLSLGAGTDRVMEYSWGAMPMDVPTHVRLCRCGGACVWSRLSARASVLNNDLRPWRGVAWPSRARGRRAEAHDNDNTLTACRRPAKTNSYTHTPDALTNALTRWAWPGSPTSPQLRSIWRWQL